MLTYKEAREKAGMTAIEVAKKLGLSKTNYSLKENYERHFKDIELVRFCQIVGCSINKLKIRGLNY